MKTPDGRSKSLLLAATIVMLANVSTLSAEEKSWKNMSRGLSSLERKITLYKPHGACWRLSNDYFILDVDDDSGALQGLYLKNDFNNANFMGNEENTATNVAWRKRYVKDMDHRAPMYGWTGDIFLKARLEDEPEDELKAMYTLFSDDIREIHCSDEAITCSYKGDSAYVGGFRNLEVVSTYRPIGEQIHWDFSVRNCSSHTMVIGELGLPIVLNTSQYLGTDATGLNHRSVENEKYLNENRVGRHFNAAGHSSCYLAVRYGGIGDYLMIIPAGDTFIEAIGEEGDYGHDSMMLTKGSMVFLYSKSATRQPYENQATELILKPGEKKSFSLRFMRARDLRELKDKCFKCGKIDAKVIPGMVLPLDGEARLLLRSIKTIHRIETDPGITVQPMASLGGHYTYRVRVSKEGQLKVRIGYGDNEWTTLMFYGIAPLEELIMARASFIAKKQQVKDPHDACCYSFRSWDNDLGRMEDVDMSPGLNSIEIGGSDDRNFAPPLFLSAKNSYYPKADEVKALDDFVERFLYGKLQDRETFTVKASLFNNYETYELLKGKPGFDSIEHFLITDDEGRETTWRRWDYVWRIYNYPHVYNIYYSMYRIAKYTGIKVSRPAREYLLFAYKTAMAAYLDSTYADTLRFRGFQRHACGNMSESHAPLGSFRLPDILNALKEEGMGAESGELLKMIERRSKHYVSEEYCFCNEFLLAGANTNHGAVYTYATLIGNERLKSTIVRMILSTKGPFPRWYHYGALANFIGSYMTSLHAVPLLNRFEETGDDYMLQLAYGSLLGHWCCVDPNGRGHNSREWRFNPVGRDDPRYNFYVNGARSLELGVGLNCNLRFLSSTLVFDEDFGVTGYGCSATETDDRYCLRPWSGFGFKAHIVPLRIRVETINTKLRAVRIAKTGDRIELDLAQTAPEITQGIVMLRGLEPGSYAVSTSQGIQQYQVADGGMLKIEAVNAQERMMIVRCATGQGKQEANVKEPAPDGRVQSMFYKAEREETGTMWDVWVYHHDATYYLYYLAGSYGKRFNNISMATSPDGVHWTERGLAVRVTGGMGTGATWKSPDFDKNGKFIMNFSQHQNIYFAESKDLLHWSRLPDEECRFAQDQRWYKENGRWDCIWTTARPAGGLYGYWTATPKRGVGFGFGVSKDGITWDVLPPPELDWGAYKIPEAIEVGSIERIGDKYFALLTAITRSKREYRVVTFAADKPEGPFVAARKNFRLLSGLPHCWFPRFFPHPDGMLVCHFSQSRNNEVSFAPLKEARLDEEGTLRLGWWKGNERMKHEPIKVEKPADPNTEVAMLGNSFDIKQGIILEGILRLPKDKDAPRRGLYIEGIENRSAGILIDGAGRAELRQMKADGTGFKGEKRDESRWGRPFPIEVDREMTFGDPARFRLLVRGSLTEFYLDDILIGSFGLPADATGRIGLIHATGDAVGGLKAWR